jgi:hypothetical protein
MAPDETPGRSNRREAWKTAFFAFLASRLLSGLFVYMGHFQRPQVPGPGVWGGISNWWLNPWTTFDSIYYIVIAGQGYRAGDVTTAFFPLYPWLLNLGGSDETGMAAAGVLISNLSFLTALYLLYRLTEMDFGPRVSKKTVWLLAFFPTTAFFSAVYTESVFLLLVLASFYAARHDRWGLAGLCGLLASLARNPGVLIFVVLALEYSRSLDYDFRRFRMSSFSFISMPLFGFIAMQTYLWYRIGVSLAGVSTQESFYRSPGWPWEPFWKDLTGFFSYLHFDFITFINLMVIILTAFFLVRFRRDLRPSYGLFMVGLILMNLIYYIKVPPHTTGTARYILTAFPFFQLLALSVDRGVLRRFARPLAGIYCYTCLLCSFLFGFKYFLG